MHTPLRVIIAPLLAILVLALSGWAPPNPPSAPIPPLRPAQPFPETVAPAAPPNLLWQVYRDPGDGDEKSGGLISAGWDDGLVVFATNLREPKSSLAAGFITKQQMEHVMSELKATGFFEEQPGKRGVRPDASSTRFSATHDGKRVEYRYTGHLVPGHDVNVDAKPEFVRFAKMWALANTVILFSAPSDFLPLDKKPTALRRYEQAKSRGEIGS